jgi:hypothetical protein
VVAREPDVSEVELVESSVPVDAALYSGHDSSVGSSATQPLLCASHGEQ